MKKLIFIISITALFISLTSCEKNLVELNSEIENDAIAYYGKVINLNDFSKTILLSNEDVDLINAGSYTKSDIGKNKTNALVPLFFDKNKILYTAKRYNKEAEESNWEEEFVEYTFWTDLKSFKTISNLKEADEKYVDGLPNKKNEIIWIFDPYVKFFTETSYEKVPNKDLLKSTPTWGLLGNIIYAKWDDNYISDYLGHTGGITQIPQSSSTDIGYLMRSTKTMEASNNGKIISGISIGTPDGVFERYMSNNGNDGWNSPLVYQRYALWYSGISSSQRLAIVNYMKAQDGEDYNLSSSKTNTSQWYCSKLQWKAYKEVLNIDIDNNGGPFVSPNDIKNSSILVGMSF